MNREYNWSKTSIEARKVFEQPGVWEAVIADWFRPDRKDREWKFSDRDITQQFGYVTEDEK